MSDAVAAWLDAYGHQAFGGGIIVIGSVVLWTSRLCFQEATRARRIAETMSTFEAVEGQVTESYVATHTTRYGTQVHTPFIQYVYGWQGRAYRSRRMLPIEFNPGTERGWADDWVARYPQRSAVTVYVDPAHPRDSVVVRDAAVVPGNSRELIIGGVVLLVLGLIMLGCGIGLALDLPVPPA